MARSFAGLQLVMESYLESSRSRIYVAIGNVGYILRCAVLCDSPVGTLAPHHARDFGRRM